MAANLATRREPPAEAELVARAVAGAVGLQRNGKVNEAALLYEQILKIVPDHFDALHLLGVARQQQGHSAEALSLIDAALRRMPQSADALANRGVALKSLNRLDEALSSYDAALAVNPGQIDALINRARILLLLDRYDAALEACDLALEQAPANPDAMGQKAHALLRLGRAAEALAIYDGVLTRRPADLETLNARSMTLLALNWLDQALDCVDHALAIDPEDTSAIVNRGNVLFRLGRMDEALSCAERIVSAKPDHVDALNNRGVALCSLIRFEEAIQSFRHALAVAPDKAEVHYSLALALLTLGDFADGWREYEWRWQSARWKAYRRDFAVPQWDGKESVAGKCLLLHAEQGMGDAIQFVRYAPLLAQRGARVIVEVPYQLKALFGAIPSIEVVERGDPVADFDLHCALMSLPFALGTDLTTIPRDVPYLAAAPDRLARWRRRLGERRSLRVGVVWQGSPAHEGDALRSIPLDVFGGVLSTPGIQFVSLQRDLSLRDAGVLNGFAGVLDIGEELADFADSAAVIALLDLVVTVDTAPAHLAGALGKPVWILLPFAPDFRWMLERSDSPWYPTARLFRQTARGDWTDPLQQIRDALPALAKSE
jgi:tetratricopeptide (TPR) repeat protein